MRFTESNVNQAVGPKMKEKSFVIKQKHTISANVLVVVEISSIKS